MFKRCEPCLGLGTIHDVRFGAVECPSCAGTGQRRKSRVPALLVRLAVFAVFVLSPVWIESSRAFADVDTNPHLPGESCTG